MKLKLVYNGIYLLMLSLIMCSVSIAQSKSKEKNDYDCDLQPIGMFYQLFDENIDLSMLDYDFGLIVMPKESDIQEKRYTLKPLDEVVPRYKFLLLRGESKPSTKNRCNATINIRGRLISPSGKWFEFKEATYNFPTGVLKFTTVERDGITFEVEAKFSVKSVAMIEDINVKLKASGETLGTVLMEFKMG